MIFGGRISGMKVSPASTTTQSLSGVGISKPSADRIEEAHLAPYLYIVRVIHRGEE